MEHFGTLLKDISGKRWLSQDELRSFAGKTRHVANIVFSWWPLITEIGGAISHTEKATAPYKGVWTRQVRPALKWLRICMKGCPATLSRSLEFADCWHQGVNITLILDASLWGLGGLLLRDDVITSFFSSPCVRGSAEIQTANKSGRPYASWSPSGNGFPCGMGSVRPSASRAITLLP